MIRICKLLLIFLLTAVLTNASGASNTSELDDYLQKIANKCWKCYFPPQTWECCISSESFILNSNGTVSQIKIILHPKLYGTKRTSLIADKALELAVQNAVPFSKPPECLHTPAKLVLIMDGSDLKAVKPKVVLSKIDNKVAPTR